MFSFVLGWLSRWSEGQLHCEWRRQYYHLQWVPTIKKNVAIQCWWQRCPQFELEENWRRVSHSKKNLIAGFKTAMFKYLQVESSAAVPCCFHFPRISNCCCMTACHLRSPAKIHFLYFSVIFRPCIKNVSTYLETKQHHQHPWVVKETLLIIFCRFYLGG